MFVSGGQINVTSEFLEFQPVKGNVYIPNDYADRADEIDSLYFKTMLSDYGVFLFKKALIQRLLGMPTANSKFNSGVFFSVVAHVRGTKIKLFNPETKRGSSFIVPYEKTLSLVNALSRARYFSSEIYLGGELLQLKAETNGLRVVYSTGGSFLIDLAEVEFLKEGIWAIARGKVKDVYYEHFDKGLSLRIYLQNKDVDRVLYKDVVLQVNEQKFPFSKEIALEFLSAC
jgi:hypothetical protein